MSTFAEKLRQDRRLVMLRLLAEQHTYMANSSVLHAGLMHLGVASSRDDVLTDLHWLGDQSLLTLSSPVPGVEVATLTMRGHDVSLGVAIVPGVSKPSPK